MRISTQQVFSIANTSMQRANEAISKTQQQLSTGQRILTPADDPVAATKVIKLQEDIARIEQYGNNISIAENNLQLEETTLNGVINLTQRIQELTIQSGNTGTLTSNEYTALASEVDSRLDELFNLVNTRNANGDYIFSGFKGGTQPFVGDASSGFSYQGDEGQTAIKISNSTRVNVSDSGKDIFMDIASPQNTVITSASSFNTANPAAQISMGAVVDQAAYDAFYPKDMVITFNDDAAVVPAGKNYTITERLSGNVIGQPNQPFSPADDIIVNGVSFRITGTPASAQPPATAGDQFFIDSSEKQDVLTTMARLSEAMRGVDNNDPASKDRMSEIAADTLTALSNVQTNVLEKVSELGARFNAIDSMREQHLDTKLVSQEVLSELKDLDYAEAASRLSAQTLILEAAQATFVRVSGLTLFSRL